MALKYFFEKFVLYEIYSKKIEGDEYLCPCTVHRQYQCIVLKYKLYVYEA